jgi:hypothetical protein
LKIHLCVLAGLSSAEQRWIAAKITSFLQSLPGQPASEAAPKRRLSMGQQISQDVQRHAHNYTPPPPPTSLVRHKIFENLAPNPCPAPTPSCHALILLDHPITPAWTGPLRLRQRMNGTKILTMLNSSSHRPYVERQSSHRHCTKRQKRRGAGNEGET